MTKYRTPLTINLNPFPLARRNYGLYFEIIPFFNYACKGKALYTLKITNNNKMRYKMVEYYYSVE